MNKKSDYNFATDVICSAMVWLFMFIYLYFFQCDLLTYAQGVLSEGKTVYNPAVGAIVLTSVLALLKMAVSRLAHSLYSFSALYHLPSLLILGFVCDVSVVEGANTSVYGDYQMMIMVVLVLAVIMVYVCANHFLKNMNLRFSEPWSGVFTNMVLTMVLMGLTIGIGNSDESDHVRLSLERDIINHRYEKVCERLSCHEVCDAHTTMLKAAALAHESALGEEMFMTPTMYGSQNLIPTHDNRLLILPQNDIYKMLRGVPTGDMKAREMLELMNRRGKISPIGRQYLYMSCLLDCDLDAFVTHIYADSTYASAPAVTDVPRYYREALTLYKYLHGDVKMDVTTPEMAANFRDFQDMQKKHADRTERDACLRDSFGDTYWYFYFKHKASF